MCGRSHLSLPPQRLRDSAAQHIGANLNQTIWVNQALYQPQFNFTSGACLPLFYIDKEVEKQNDLDKKLIKTEPKEEKIKQEDQPIVQEDILVKSENDSPVVKKEEELEPISGLCIRTMNWGIYSQKAKTFSMNIRSESVAEKFGSILRKNRAILFVEGFYEWKSSTSGGKGQPYYIHPKQKGSLICLACLFDKKGESGGEEYSFSVLTVDADKTFSQIHHRMPAILTNIEDVRKWLGINEDYSTSNPLQSLLSLLKPYDFSQYLDMYKVSDFVNTTANNTSKCIKPLSQVQHGKGSLHSFFKPIEDNKKKPLEKRVKEDKDSTSLNNIEPSHKKIKTEPIDLTE